MSSKLTVDVWWERGFLHGVALERTFVARSNKRTKKVINPMTVSEGFLLFEINSIQVISAPPKTRTLSR